MSPVISHAGGETSGAPKIIFITSLSHSGSTLLDLMLNAHSEVVSVGEVKQLGRFVRKEKANGQIQCTCGAETLLACEFWNGVSARTQAETGRTLGELNVENYQEKAQFDTDNVALFEAIAGVAGKRYIVDSSKHATRLALLLANPALSVHPIFLLRDPKGQICSSVKTESSLSKRIGNYVRTNREIHQLLKHRAHSVVRYEELVRDPERVLAALMRQLGLTFEPAQLEWAAPKRHNVGGNGMRRSGSSALKLDEKWREEFNLLQKLAIDAGTLFARYPFARSMLPGRGVQGDG